jgi:hypothetical protein
VPGATVTVSVCVTATAPMVAETTFSPLAVELRDP